MKTRTTIETPSSDIKISHEDRLITIGSCFADRIGRKFAELKYQGSFNPFGILYNPVSILQTIQSLALDISPIPQHFCLLEGVYVHHDYHSDLSASTTQAYIDLISEKQLASKRLLTNAHTIILTVGSAYVYEHKETGRIIANCHKQPANQFHRRLLSYEECKQALIQLVEVLLTANPSIRIIFTISPVRHIRDTIVGNSRSKAMLLNAVHHTVEKYDVCNYYPAYEIMMDDLRDYRYYEDDMIHPTNKAFEYIWDLFAAGYITTASQQLNIKIEKILKSVHHRPFRKNSESHQDFIKTTLSKMEKVQEELPTLDWSQETDLLQSFKLF